MSSSFIPPTFSLWLIGCVCMRFAEAWHFNCASNQIGKEAVRKVGEWWGVRGCTEGCRPTVTMVNHFCQNHQGHNCWPAALWDFGIAYCKWTQGFLSFFPSLHIFPLLCIFFLSLSLCTFLLFFFSFAIWKKQKGFLFCLSLLLSYLRLTKCTIMRPLVLLNPLCMACAGSGSEHSLFSVIIIQFANTEALC